MIFSVPGHIDLIKKGGKTQTRRKPGHYREGGLYVIQPSRGKPGILNGKILVTRIVLEAKWETVTLWESKAEGGYTPEEYESLYEKLHPGWETRDALWFTYIPKSEEMKKT